jgi:hypothetical protein
MTSTEAIAVGLNEPTRKARDTADLRREWRNQEPESSVTHPPAPPLRLLAVGAIGVLSSQKRSMLWRA